jgi:hypothetical protein
MKVILETSGVQNKKRADELKPGDTFYYAN